MKEIFIYIPIVIIYLSLKSSLMPSMPLPDLSVIIIYYIAIKRPSIATVILAFSFGYIEDIFYGTVVGTSSASNIIVFLIVFFISKKLTLTTPYVIAVVNVILVMIKFLFVTLVGLYVGANGMSFFHAIPLALMTGLVSPLAVQIINVISIKANIEVKKGDFM